MRTQEENLKMYQWLIKVNRAIEEIGEERLKKYIFRVEK